MELKNQENLEKIVDLLKVKINENNENIVSKVEEIEEVKSGDLTVKDVLAEPTMILYSKLLKSAVELLETDEAKGMLDPLVNEFTDLLPFANLIYYIMFATVNSAYNGILTYDEMLKVEVKSQLDLIIDNVNKLIADSKAHDAVIQMLNRKVSNIEKNMKISEVKSEMNIE